MIKQEGPNSLCNGLRGPAWRLCEDNEPSCVGHTWKSLPWLAGRWPFQERYTCNFQLWQHCRYYLLTRLSLRVGFGFSVIGMVNPQVLAYERFSICIDSRLRCRPGNSSCEHQMHSCVIFFVIQYRSGTLWLGMIGHAFSDHILVETNQHQRCRSCVPAATVSLLRLVARREIVLIAEQWLAESWSRWSEEGRYVAGADHMVSPYKCRVKDKMTRGSSQCKEAHKEPCTFYRARSVLTSALGSRPCKGLDRIDPDAWKGEWAVSM
jgi:hypothetical protein